jgi:hypothetical protein
MSVPIQTTEELLSIAHVSAIVAYSGHISGKVEHDFGVDIEVRRIGNFDGKRIDLGTIIDLQLKSTINWEIKKEYLVYDITVEAYNRLVMRNNKSSTPCILVVCCLPNDNSKWLDVREKKLILRKCCYYFFVSGSPSRNKRSVRLKIPRAHLLTPETIDNLVSDQIGGT